MSEENKSPATEEELLALSCQQDQAAFGVLVGSWTPRFFALSMSILRDRQQAEEVLQDAFYRIWNKACSYDPGLGRASSWMFAILHRLSIDRLRKNKSKGGDKVTPHEDIALFAPFAKDGTDPWQRLRMQAALETLTEAQRTVVTLAYFEGLSREEMAERLGEPKGTIKTRLRDALVKLRRQFRDPAADLQALERSLLMSGRR